MKTRLTIIALGALVLLAGCDRSKATPDVTTFDLTVLAESAGTRATVDGTTGAFAWEAGDQIAIYLNSGYQSATLTAAGTTTLAAAAGSVRDGYAIFPASVAAGTASAPSVTLPASYNIEGSLSSLSAKTPMIAVNDPDSDILRFHHLGGLLRLNISGIPAGTTDVTVTLAERHITGNFTVANPASATPTISTSSGDADGVVTFHISTAGLAASSSATLNLPLPCGSYTGISVNTVPAASGFPVSLGAFTLGRAEGRQLTVTP